MNKRQRKKSDKCALYWHRLIATDGQPAELDKATRVIPASVLCNGVWYASAPWIVYQMHKSLTRRCK